MFLFAFLLKYTATPFAPLLSGFDTPFTHAFGSKKTDQGTQIDNFTFYESATPDRMDKPPVRKRAAEDDSFLIKQKRKLSPQQPPSKKPKEVEADASQAQTPMEGTTTAVEALLMLHQLPPGTLPAESVLTPSVVIPPPPALAEHPPQPIPDSTARALEATSQSSGPQPATGKRKKPNKKQDTIEIYPGFSLSRESLLQSKLWGSTIVVDNIAYSTMRLEFCEIQLSLIKTEFPRLQTRDFMYQHLEKKQFRDLSTKRRILIRNCSRNKKGVFQGSGPQSTSLLHLPHEDSPSMAISPPPALAEHPPQPIPDSAASTLEYAPSTAGSTLRQLPGQAKLSTDSFLQSDEIFVFSYQDSLPIKHSISEVRESMLIGNFLIIGNVAYYHGPHDRFLYNLRYLPEKQKKDLKSKPVDGDLFTRMSLFCLSYRPHRK